MSKYTISWMNIKTTIHLLGLIAVITESVILSIPVWSNISPAHQFYLGIAALGLLLVIIVAAIVIDIARR